jgi:RNA polymerase sigma factor (sigma-70 family)
MAVTLGNPSIVLERGEFELVRAARGGDDLAFEELYARYRDRILAFIRSRVRDHGRAEDVAQEVFLSALQRLRATSDPVAFRPWIYEIAKNGCIDEFRRGSRMREVPLEAEAEFITEDARGVLHPPTPPHAIEGKQQMDDLRGAFGGLSATQHQLLVMREFEGLSYAEIGERLGMTRSMVESGLFRARRRLHEEYEELASGRRCIQVQSAVDAGRLQSMGGLGLRDRRRFARHLSHCQPCRHVALGAGVDPALLDRRGIASKIAALLPLPAWLLPRGGGTSAVVRPSPEFAAPRLLDRLSRLGGAGDSMLAGRPAAGLAALALAGAGGGLAHVMAASVDPPHPLASPGAASAPLSAPLTAAAARVLEPASVVSVQIGVPSGVAAHGLERHRLAGGSALVPGGGAASGDASARRSRGSLPAVQAPPPGIAALAAPGHPGGAGGLLGNSAGKVSALVPAAAGASVKLVASAASSVMGTVGSVTHSELGHVLAAASASSTSPPAQVSSHEVISRLTQTAGVSQSAPPAAAAPAASVQHAAQEAARLVHSVLAAALASD